MQKYRDRQEAGKALAKALQAYKDRSDVIVLALPRGGVPVAFEISKSLNLLLDVFIVRKLGVPGHEELAMGAIAMGGMTVFNEDVLQEFPISQDAIQCVIQAEQQELNRRIKKYRGNRSLPELQNKIVILVDDGIATGATLRAAIQAIRQLQPAEIVVAVPVAEKITSENISKLVDHFICPLVVTNFHAVGMWYEVFNQTTDQEVAELLAKS